jgi:hypothetical protein
VIVAGDDVLSGGRNGAGNNLIVVRVAWRTAPGVGDGSSIMVASIIRVARYSASLRE